MGRREQDHYARRAQAENMPARSVYKLAEIDKKHQLFRGVQRVLDLGCRPGSWSIYARRTRPDCKLLGIDIYPVDDFPGTFLELSIEDLTAEIIQEHLRGAPDIVMSDMAPNTSGNKSANHYQQIALAELALEIAVQQLAPGGVFVCKVFDGADAPSFVNSVRAHFKTTKRLRPKAVKKMSREFYVLGLGFKG